MEGLLIVLLAIALSIVIGHFFKINVGVIALVFAYLASVLIFDIKVADIFTHWPSKLFVIIFSVTFFYGSAINNGAIEVLALKILYALRKRTALLPIAIYVISSLIAGLGGGPYVTNVIMIPVTLKLAALSGMSPLLGGMAIFCAGAGASTSYISVAGMLVKGFVETSSYASFADVYQHENFINAMVFSTVAFLVFYVAMRGYRLKPVVQDVPPVFTRKQKASMTLIFGMIALYVLPTILALVVPQNITILKIKGKLDFALIALIGSVLSIMLRLSDEKTLFKSVPWHTLIMISGMGVLMGVAKQAGIITQLASLISGNLSATSTLLLMITIAFIMSYVSDGLGVVFPALIPIAISLAEFHTMSPSIFITSVCIGASLPVMSPFSSGGAMYLSFVATDNQKQILYNQLLYVPFAMLAICYVVFLTGIVK
ncbi:MULTISPECIES: SLC13 family permease [Sphaerochaeta]|jgi:di/tricarboxylate transporter|uniref:Dicarboxylate carrier MatC N-terminal domain-containing protein n=1 Tax=Sphaerochaeta associata TaxID=1129264 RepID=A0ABY4D9M3_9SPIR|nr:MULTISPECIES: SLC13 family permease [Sphaerochaeta]MDX9982699.1 SLC13 family permease [Sphaerochaeta sp.]UOM50143.1 hypothetical protein MUG09_11320 [Sphaerochaeta associata]SMP44270.1 transporter, UIT1 family [Sphaerochaeta associata]